MKGYTAAVALLVSFVVWTRAGAWVYPYDPNTMQYPVSVEQAFEAARNWAGDPSLELRLDGVSRFLDSPDIADHYVLSTIDGLQEFRVDCYSGEMCRWEDVEASREYSRKLSEHWDPATQLCPEDLDIAVVCFLEEHYAGFNSMLMERLHSDPTASWTQKFPNGTWYLGNTAGCGIDRWSGDIIKYHGQHSPPPTISIDPSVSLSSAEQIAIDYVGTLLFEDEAGDQVAAQSAFVTGTWGPIVADDELGAQRLIWFISTVASLDPDYTPEDYWEEVNGPDGVWSGAEKDILVDAHTGEVYKVREGGYLGPPPRKLSRQEAAKMKRHKPDPSALKSQPRFEMANLELDSLVWEELMYPPRVVNGTGYVCAKYLPMLYGGTITWRDGAAELNTCGRHIRLTPGSKALVSDGKEIPLQHAPVLIAQRLYVPYDAVRHICGADCEWVAETRIVRLRSGDTPVKERFRRPPAPASDLPPPVSE